jgi:hypothetical protein
MGQQMSNQTTYDLVESNYEKYEPVCKLYDWSSNCEYPTPFALFLDITGYAREYIGEPLTSGYDWTANLGYMEVSYLADALSMYANKPTEVTEFVHQLLAAETSEK